MFLSKLSVSLFILGLVISVPAVALAGSTPGSMQGPSLAIEPIVVTTENPFDLVISASFPNGLSSITGVSATFAGADVLSLLLDNVSELGETSATIRLSSLQLARGTAGVFEMSLTADGQTVSDSVVIDIPVPRGVALVRPTADAGATGRALITLADGGNRLIVDLRIAGLPPNSTHANHIHRGFCPPPVGPEPDMQGPIVVALQDITVGDDGSGSQTTEAEAAGTELSSFHELLDGNFYVNVHLNSTAGGVGSGQTCGPVEFLTPRLQGNISLAPTGDPDAAGSATVVIGESGASLVTALNVSGLDPESGHANHIHRGFCPPPVGPEPDMQGPIVVGLTDVAVGDDGSGAQVSQIDASSTDFGSFDELLNGDFYVNVHLNATADGVGPGQTCGPVNLTRTDWQSNPTAFPTGDDDASGSAELVVARDGSQLIVTLNVSGLEPNTAHASHIHRGFCPPPIGPTPDAQGPIVIPLEDISVGDDGSGTRITVRDAASTEFSSFEEITDGDFYINVHLNSTADGVGAGQTCAPIVFAKSPADGA